MAGFELLMQNLEQVGFFQFLLPWMLVLGVTFGVLEKGDVFEDTAIHGVLAIVVAFSAIVGVYSIVPVNFFNQVFGTVSVFIAVILGFVIILGAAGVNFSDLSTEAKAGIAVGISILFVLVWSFAVDFWENVAPGDVATALTVVAIIAVIAWVMKPSD